MQWGWILASIEGVVKVNAFRMHSFLLTKAIEQDLPPKTDNASDSQEIPHPLWNQ
jgi:hypothetical protein